VKTEWKKPSATHHTGAVKLPYLGFNTFFRENNYLLKKLT